MTRRSATAKRILSGASWVGERGVDWRYSGVTTGTSHGLYAYYMLVINVLRSSSWGRSVISSKSVMRRFEGERAKPCAAASADGARSFAPA